MRDIYREIILSQIPRLLSLEDRNNFSSTYGCMDRDFWHYKTVKSFPSSTYQQGVLALALVYKNDCSGFGGHTVKKCDDKSCPLWNFRVED